MRRSGHADRQPTRLLGRGLITYIATVCVIALAGCTGSGSAPGKPHASQFVGQSQVGPYLGFGLDPAQPRPSFTLTDTHGNKFDFGSATAGRPTFLYFGYTNCPDVCPETMADIQQTLETVKASLAKNVEVVFVTTDVRHDTSAVISKWLSAFSAGTTATWVGLRGTQQQIDAAQASAHITLAADGGQQHSAQALLYGRDNYAHVSYLDGNDEQRLMEHDLPLIP
jgi:protein SCO1/2